MREPEMSLGWFMVILEHEINLGGGAVSSSMHRTALTHGHFCYVKLGAETWSCVVSTHSRLR